MNEFPSLLFLILIMSLVLLIGYCNQDSITQQTIKSKTPIVPELQITVKNGVPDTTYVYRFK